MGGASEAHSGNDIHELKVVCGLETLSCAFHVSLYHCIRYVSRCTCTRRMHEESLADGALKGGRCEPATVPKRDSWPNDRAPSLPRLAAGWGVLRKAVAEVEGTSSRRLGARRGVLRS